MKNGYREKVWVLEDDEGCTFVYQQILDFRYDVTYFDTLEDFARALAEARQGECYLPDLVIADIMLRDGNFLGFLSSDDSVLLEDIRLVCVSSIDDLEALRYCYEEGVLDYMVKPFSKNELVVKVAHALARPHGVPAPAPEDETALTVGDVVVRGLTVKERQLLKLFLASPDQAVSREMIMERAWRDTYVQPKTVDVHLYNLRKKLKPHGVFVHSTGKGKWALRGESGARVVRT